MGEFTLKFSANWAYGLLATCIAFVGGKIYRKQKKRFDEHHAFKKGIQALLKVEIIRTYNKYIEKGEAPIYEKENMNILFTEYENLGGNGTIKDLVAEFRELPTPNAKK